MPITCKSPENLIALAVGNGAMTRGTNSVQFAVLKTQPFRRCHQSLPYPQKSVLHALNDVNYQSICNGDIGGPLLSSVDKTLIGISSFPGRRSEFESDFLIFFLHFFNI